MGVALNPRLLPMTTQPQPKVLQAGEAFQPPLRGTGQLILLEGEVLVQSPARWLGGVLVIQPPVRLAAPATWPFKDGSSVNVVRAAKLLAVPGASWLSPDWKVAFALVHWIPALAARLVGALRHGVAAGRLAAPWLSRP